MDTQIKSFDWKERFDELLTHYRRSYKGEGNTSINRLRKEPNNVLEREIKSFIQSEIDLAVAKREGEIVSIVNRHCTWKPTAGYDCEEELGFQKGLRAEAKLIKFDILSLITNNK